MSQLRALDPDQRPVHVGLWLKRLLRRRADVLPGPPQAIRRILFVCHGNIMRSAFAEAAFRQLAAESGGESPPQGASAGLFAVPGRPSDSRALRVAEGLGLTLHGHQARQLSRADVDSADLICVMDSTNETVCISRYPGARRKVVLLGAFGRGRNESLEIEDPFLGNTETVRACFHRVHRAILALWSELRERPSAS